MLMGKNVFLLTNNLNGSKYKYYGFDPLFFFNLIVTLCLYVKATSVAYIKMNVKPTQSLDFPFSGLKRSF